MEVTELRIGNSVKCSISNDAGIYHILGFPDWTTEDKRPVIIDRCPKQIVGIDKIRPIKITEEWLIKLGFKKLNQYTIKYEGEFQEDYTHEDLPHGVEYNISDGSFSIEINEYSRTIAENIKQVHKLENFFFFLTGKELK